MRLTSIYGIYLSCLQKEVDMPRIILWLYLVVAIVNLVAKILPHEELERFSKPVLMPLLIFYVYKESIGKTTAKTLLLCLALLFSWLGDVVLLQQGNDIYFMAGIGLFLIAQITYVVVLRKATYQKPTIDIVSLIPFLLYGALLFYVLLPAGDFTIPIIVYGLVILMMTYSAYSRKNLTSVESFKWAFIGSILFVLSDTLLAINSFKMELPYAGFFIMLTYIAAQYLLVKGLLKHVD